MSSAAGFRVKPNMLSYCISKAALNQLTKNSALDLVSESIRVNAINPVVIETAILGTAFGLDPELETEFSETKKNLYPVRTLGEVTDTSAANEYLIGNSASFMVEH